MANFTDFDIEVQDEKGNIPEQFNGSVTTSGSPVTITPSSGKIVAAEVFNPNRGTNANGFDDNLLVSFDGGSTFRTVPRGGTIAIESVYLDDFQVDANNDGTNYEIILTHD